MSNLATIVNNILADSGIDDINVVVTTGSYANPAWIVSLPWTKITGTPTTIAGYGITNAYTKTEVDTLLSGKQNTLTLTTTGTSGAATLVGSTLNIPQYEAEGNYVTLDTTQTITGQKTFSRGAASFGGTTQSLLIDGDTQNGALTINSNGSAPFAYQTFSQAGVGKFEMGIVGTSSNGSFYINRNIQVGESGASIYIKKSNGFVGIFNNDPQVALHITGAGIFSSSVTASIAALATAASLFVVSDSGTLKSRTAAQVLSDIGGQPSGNYVTLDTAQTITGKKTFSNAFGDNNPIIALVGTSTDTWEYLTTAYNASLEAGKQVAHFLGKSSSAKNSGYLAYQWNAAGSDNNFISLGHYNNDHLLRVYANGDVNTSNFFGVQIRPSYTFQVYSDADVWHTVIGGGTGQLRIGGQTADGAVIQAYTVSGGVANRNVYLQRDGANVIINGITDWGDRLQVNGSTRISTRLGIGDSSGIYSLQLGTNGSLTNSIRMGNYQVAKNTRQYIGYTRFDSGLFESSGNGDSPSTVLGGVAGIRIVNTEGTLFSPAADNSVQLLTHIYNGGSRVALHASYSGNVGINGITDPTAALDVNGTGRFSSNLTLSSAGNAFVLLNNTTPSTGRQWRVSSGSNGTLFFTHVGVVDALQIAPSTGAATFSNLAGTGTRMVVADSSGTLSTQSIPDLSGYVTLTTAQTITGQKTISRSADAFSGTTQSFLIDGAAGNGALTINSASAYAYQTFAQAGTGKFEIGIVGTVGAQYGSLYINRNIQTGETGASIYVKKSDGAVGILNINPSYALDVTGVIRASGIIRSDATNGLALGSIAGYRRLQYDLANTRFGFLTDTNGLANIEANSALLSGATINGVLTINRNTTGLVINRDAVTNYNGIYYSTAGSARWFIGLRENLSSNNYICYSEQTAVDVMTLNLADNSASFAGNLFNNGLLRTAGSSNVIWWSGATQTASFGAVLGDSTSTRTAFFRSSSTTGGASVWWGLVDSSGRNIPCAAIDGISTGGLTFWNNTAGSGGGDWTKIFEYNANGVGINTTPSGTYRLNVSGSVQASSFFESSDMRFKTNIQDYESDEILKIPAKIYEKEGKLEVGYLAQDLQNILNCAVSTREDGYLDLSYRQVHTAKIAMLEKRIAELEQQLKNK